jgi:aspartate/methionine/tyrosine aminotransferase
MIRPNTKAIYVNTPHNPTGLLMERQVLDAVVEIARDAGATLFCDEVYRDLEHDPTDRLPAACELYNRAICLGSMSKTYGLPGLRLGWVTSRDMALLRRIQDLKLYTTICNSAPSEFLTTLALRNSRHLLGRNLGVVQHNIPLLEAFLARRADHFQWIHPNAAPIGFPRVHGLGPVDELCERLVRETGVLLLPGTVYDQPEHVRMGYGRKNMPEALARLDAYLG